MAITALGFGSTPFSLPFAVFTPVSWNGSGTTVASGATTPYVQSGGGSGITASLLAASQANLQQTINQSLAITSSSGAYETNYVGQLFNNWAGTLGSIGTTNANAFAEAVSKSAHACSGFFSCLFG